jgi:hypothetical protein
LVEFAFDTKVESRLSATLREQLLSTPKLDESFKSLEKSKYDTNSQLDRFAREIDRVFDSSQFNDFAAIVNQNNSFARTHKFWESTHSLSNAPTKITFDSFLFVDKHKSRQVLDFAQSLEVLPSSLSSVATIRELIRDLISLAFYKHSNAFSVSDDGTLTFKDWKFQVDSVSSSLLRKYLFGIGSKLNCLYRFFELRDALTSQKTTSNLFERNFFLNFVNIFDEYLSFQVIALFKCHSILELTRKLEVVWTLSEQVVNFFDVFEKRKTQLNLLDFISVTRVHIPPSDDISELVKEAFHLSIFPVFKTIYQVMFKNSPIDLLTKNLQITYEQDQDFNYKASNVPDFLERTVENILITKNNYLLLSSADSELFSMSVKSDFPWFESLNVEDIRRVYQEVRAQLIGQQVLINEIINKRMVF